MKKIILLAVATALTASANDFAFKLYDRLREAEGNLLFSPASIEAALAMTREGAAGNTLCQMNALLPETSLFPAVGTNVTLESANAIWIDRQFPVLDPFKAAVSSAYDAEIRSADFAGQPEAERQLINAWVERKTRDKIRDLLPAGSVSPMTRLILANAIYFKGDWLHAFEKEKTSAAPFHLSPTNTVEVSMMTMKPETFGYTETERLQLLELPYTGKEVSMLLLLPKDTDGLPQLEAELSVKKLAEWRGALRRRDVHVCLPCFKIESSFDGLAATLASLGLSDAFTPSRADFSGISRIPLFISDVVHKAFIEVNEEGTEAAAATGVIMRTTSLPPPPVRFSADHPFLFMILDKQTGTVLFMGRLTDPEVRSS